MYLLVARIAAAVYEALRPELQDIRNELNCLKEAVSELNETVTTLAEESEEQMATYHTETETKLDDLQISLQSVDTRVLLLLLPYLNDIEHDIKTELGQTIEGNGESLSEEMKEHRNQTALELADIQSSLQFACQKLIQLIVYLHRLQSTLVTGMIQGFNTTSSELTSHDTKLDSLNTQIAGHFNDVRTQLSVVSNEICDKIEDHERHMESELDDLESTLSNQTNQGFTSLDCATSSEVTLHDAKLDSLSTQITSDFNGARTDLNSISDRMKNHDRKTDNKLLDIVCLHQDANGTCYTCGGTGGWRRAVYLDMTDLNTNCPPGWSETNYSKRTCGRATDVCDSAYFPVSGGVYSQVCGMIRAYQWGATLAFYGNYDGLSSINDVYFTGVAVMHGSPRQHIWTFAAGAVENASGDSTVNQHLLCPCDTSVNITIPPFVGNDYFCESGYVWPGRDRYIPNSIYVLHSDDPLWDGQGCISNSTCCSLNNPPCFTKTLATPTTDDLELRLCFYHHSSYEDVAVELIELYVK